LKSYKQPTLKQIVVSRINEKDLKEIEKRSLEMGNWISHPLLGEVKIYGKDYKCTKHSKIGPLHRGTMRQHIEGKEHKLDFFTGKPLEKTKKLPPLEIPQNKKDELLEDNPIQKTATEDYSEEVLPLKSKSSEKIDSGTSMWAKALRMRSKPAERYEKKENYQEIDEFDQKIKDWKKAQYMMNLNMSKQNIDEFLLEKGLMGHSAKNERNDPEFKQFLNMMIIWDKINRKPKKLEKE